MQSSASVTTRSGRPFVGRNDLIRRFKDVLVERQKQIDANKSDVTPKVLNFHGVSGIGKSELIPQLRRAAGEQFHATVFAGMEFQAGTNVEVDLTLRAIRREAKSKFKVEFTAFDIGFAIYWKVARPDFTLRQSDFPFWDESSIAAGLLKETELIPLVGWLPKMAKLTVKLSTSIRQYWTERAEPLLKGLQFLNKDKIRKRLPLLLAADLEAYTAKAKVKTPLVLYFDAYESLWGDRRKPSNVFYEDVWVRDLIRSLPSALFVICGQERVRWPEKFPECREWLELHELTRLSGEHVDRYLVDSGVMEKRIRARIATGSHGVPFYLDLSVNTYQHTIADGKTPEVSQFGGTFDEIFERFLRNLKEYEQLALKVLSAARSWDRSLGKKLLREFVTSFPLTELDEFHRFSFVKSDPATGRFTLHDLLRDHLTRSIEFADFQKSDVHPFLFEHYDSILNDIDIKNITDQKKRAIVEGFYHGRVIYGAVDISKWTIRKSRPFEDAAEGRVIVPLYKRLIELFDKPKPSERSQLATVLNNLAELYRLQGKYDLAEPLYKQAMEIDKEALREAHPDFADSLNNLASLYQDQGKYDLAEPLYKQALEIHREVLGETHPSFATSLNNLAELYRLQGKYDLAEPLYKEALEIRREVLGEVHPDFAGSLNNLAGLYRLQGKYHLAEPLYKQALAIVIKVFGKYHPRIALTHENLAVLYSEISNQTLAERHKTKAEAIRAELAKRQNDSSD